MEQSERNELCLRLFSGEMNLCQLEMMTRQLAVAVECIVHDPGRTPNLSSTLEHKDLSISRCLGDMKPVTLNYLFQATALQYPNKTAIETLNTWEEASKSITYFSLERRANGVATALREEHFVKDRDVVAVSAEKCLSTYVLILGILKAGATYLPLAPELPRDRIRAIFEVAKPVLCLTDLRTREHYVSSFSNIKVTVLATELELDSAPFSSVDPDDVAYIIFTSGSTGMSFIKL